MTEPFISNNGTQYWMKSGMYHRTDGPAIIYTYGAQSWFIDDIKYYTPKAYQEAANLSDEDMTAILLRYNF